MIRYRLRSRYKAEGFWTYQEVLAESQARFCQRQREYVEIPDLRREAEQLVASGEADEPTRGAAVAMKKQPKRKAAAKSQSQRNLF